MHAIIYRSVAKTVFEKTDIYKMLSLAREYNARHGITGCLLYHENQFLQMLEGPKEHVCGLYERIKQDPRHTEVTTLQVDDKAARLFDEWSMAYHDFGDGALSTRYKLRQVDEIFNESRAFTIPSRLAMTFFENVKTILVQN